MKRRTFIVGLGGLSALALGGWTAWHQSSQKAVQANRSLVAAAGEPDIQAFFDAQLPDLAGQAVPMESWHGKPLVLNFWASWCGPCVREMPALEELAKEQSDVHVLGIAIDSQANVEKFLKKVPVTFPIYVAGHGGIGLTRKLGNAHGGLPFTVLVDASGQLVSSIQGEIDPQDLRERIGQTLV